jgi:hypothetical protein
MNLTEECLKVYWELGEYSIDDTRRMKAVIKLLSGRIRTWAPTVEQARICHMAVNEVADRMLRDSGQEVA